MAVFWTRHAQQAIQKRGLLDEQIEQILATPIWLVPDKTDASLWRAFGKHEGVDQFVRVVFRNLSDDDMVVITVHPDRDAIPPV